MSGTHGTLWHRLTRPGRWPRRLRRAGLRLGAAAVGAVIVLTLAGCGAMQPVTKHEIVTVGIEVPVPCRTAPVQKPAFELDRADPKADIHTKGKLALAEVEQRRAYGVLLEAAVVACQ